jgi:hypothetical protein
MTATLTSGPAVVLPPLLPPPLLPLRMNVLASTVPAAASTPGVARARVRTVSGMLISVTGRTSSCAFVAAESEASRRAALIELVSPPTATARATPEAIPAIDRARRSRWATR